MFNLHLVIDEREGGPPHRSQPGAKQLSWVITWPATASKLKQSFETSEPMKGGGGRLGTVL